MERKKKSTSWLYIIFMAALSSVLCFFELSRNSLRLDEVSSVVISRSFPSLLHIIWTQEFNMWLYYIVLHFWMMLGTGEFMLRSLSVIFAIMTVVVFYKFAEEICSEKIAKTATALFSISIYFIYFAQLARSYSFAVVLVLLSSFFFVKYLKNNKKMYAALYTVFAVAAVYTHVLTIFVIGMQYISLFFYPRKVTWKKHVLMLGILFFSLIPLFLSKGTGQLDWLARPPLVHLPFGIIALGGDFIPLAIISCGLILILILTKFNSILQKTEENFYFVWLLLWAFVPLFFSFIFSFLIKPIYQPQYFNSSFPAFILLVSMGLSTLANRKNLYRIILGALILLSLLRLYYWYSGQNNFLTQYVVFENVTPDDWKSAANYVEKNGKLSDVIIFYSYFVRSPFEYYYQQAQSFNKPKTLEISSAPYSIGGGTNLPQPNMSLINSLQKKYNRVWLVIAYSDFSTLSRKEQLIKIESSLLMSYKQTEDISSNQVEIKLFKKI